MSEKILTAITANGVEYKIGGATKVVWDANSNMNDFKTAGTYEIYGERRNLADNLPILNSNPGHSIAAKLTVVDSSLRKTDGTLPTEICVTQFLMLSNRQGGDGNLYVRTYNENNSPFTDGWTPWQKLQGNREGYIFTDSDGWDIANIHGAPSELGMNHMIDNGIYTGIYTDDNYFNGTPSFLETFTLIVINNYAVAGQDSRLKRTISQLKYAVDAITNQASVKQRTKTDGDTVWSDWTDIGGGGSQEVDITDAVKAYGLPTLIGQGLAKEGVNYIINLDFYDINNVSQPAVLLDNNNKIISHLRSKASGSASLYYLSLKLIKAKNANVDIFKIFELTVYEFDGDSDGKYYKYIISYDLNNVKVSTDMTTL
jgi:hypothetical protein